jgi:DEAD/DEAH box helicase domain-containing protein
MATREQFQGLQVESGVEAALEGLRAKAEPSGAIVAERYFPAREARTAAFPEWVDARLAEVYRSKGIERLYTHQAEAAELVHEGKNLVVVTPTASGKTLCYNLPVLNQILADAATRALYLFPTKALAQDQLAELYSLIERLDEGIGVNTYDGDTPADQRKATRAQAHIVLSNPDMLHTGILPHHTRWQRLFENLRFVVLMSCTPTAGFRVAPPTCCGGCGGCVASTVGAAVHLLVGDVANPKELAERLLEAPVELIEESGAPSAASILFYNPPVVNEFSAFRSYVNESARLATHFLTTTAKRCLCQQPPGDRAAGQRAEAEGIPGAGRGVRNPRLPRRLPAGRAARD